MRLSFAARAAQHRALAVPAPPQLERHRRLRGRVGDPAALGAQRGESLAERDCASNAAAPAPHDDARELARAAHQRMAGWRRRPAPTARAAAGWTMRGGHAREQWKGMRPPPPAHDASASPSARAIGARASVAYTEARAVGGVTVKAICARNRLPAPSAARSISTQPQARLKRGERGRARSIDTC